MNIRMLISYRYNKVYNDYIYDYLYDYYHIMNITIVIL